MRAERPPLNKRGKEADLPPLFVFALQEFFDPLDDVGRLIDDFFRQRLKFLSRDVIDFPRSFFCLLQKIRLPQRLGVGVAQDSDAISWDALGGYRGKVTEIISAQ